MDSFGSTKAAIVSIISAIFGEIYHFLPLNITIESANIFFQHFAWTIAILAGIVSIVNGTKKWFCKDKKEDGKE